MRFDFTAAELFLAYWRGQVPLSAVLDHPAYQTVRQHAALFSDGLSEQDIVDACRGQASPFYGLDNLSERLPRIYQFIELLRRKADSWSGLVETTLSELFPEENFDIPIYPIIGYDMGIGLHGTVCLNCNYEPYLREPEEFLFYIVHECTHVIYERHHRIPSLLEMTSASQWCSTFNLSMQNEGYAVYAPLKLRQGTNHLAERDYRVLFDPDELERHRVLFLDSMRCLKDGSDLPQEEYLNICFGPHRLTYRLGCECIRRIERNGGLTAVREAFYLDCDEFVDRYIHLLES